MGCMGYLGAPPPTGELKKEGGAIGGIQGVWGGTGGVWGGLSPLIPTWGAEIGGYLGGTHGCTGPGPPPNLPGQLKEGVWGYGRVVGLGGGGS